jgi:thiamine kinase-like enzyme
LKEISQETIPAGDYITILFIVRYLERIGDSLLNIGEAILFVIIGERIKINQFQALQQTLNQSGFANSFDEVDLQLIWGTRSGCRIGRLENKEQGTANAQNSIFKEGALKKIREEKQCLETWQEMFPGLVPKVFSYYEEDEDRASLLLELMPGCTFDEIIVTADHEELTKAYEALEKTLDTIWRQTLIQSACRTNYMQQLRDRFDAVLQIHPQFFRKHQCIGPMQSPSTDELLQKCQELEQTLLTPFQIFIHGDFNVNNIVHNHENHHIHFIDLHRSKYFDCIQDISVFLVSNFRMPVFETGLRKRLNWISIRFFDFSRAFAREHGDETFELRLALGLARSFYTSTRFELGPDFSREMFLRAHFLMDTMSCYLRGARKHFHFPEEVLVYS